MYNIAAPKTWIAALLLPALIYYNNPAIALLVGATLSLVFNQSIIPKASMLGKYALQTAIVLLGLKLNAQELLTISADYSVVVTGYVVFTLLLGLALGRVLGTETKSNQLISSATAICGGTAIASISPIIHAKPEQTGLVLTLVFLLNAVALFTFPIIGEYFALTQEQFGVWVALAIHDTSSVVATSAIYGDEAAKIATTVKLGRTLWLIPLLLVLSIMQQANNAKLRIPGFVILFIVVACFGSFVTLPNPVLNTVSIVYKALLVLALYCIGTQISRQTLYSLRGRVLLQGLLLWAIVIFLTLALVLNL